MGGERILTKEGLKVMGERTLDLLQASIEDCDMEMAKKTSQRM